MKVVCLPGVGMSCNCYLARTENGGGWIVDPGDDPERILSAVKENDFAPQAVLLTHAHFDHIGAARAVCSALAIPLWIGAGDAAFLTDADSNLSRRYGSVEIRNLHADRLLREGDVLSQGTESLRVLETPGHTPGSLCFLGDGILFSGDTLFYESIGTMDFPGGDWNSMRSSIVKLQALPGNYVIYPGHGESTTMEHERNHNPYNGVLDREFIF